MITRRRCLMMTLLWPALAHASPALQQAMQRAREAMRDALRRLGSGHLAGCVLVSTSRPCRICEAAAGEARIARMVHGDALTDAGPPR